MNQIRPLTVIIVMMGFWAQSPSKNVSKMRKAAYKVELWNFAEQSQYNIYQLILGHG